MPNSRHARQEDSGGIPILTPELIKRQAQHEVAEHMRVMALGFDPNVTAHVRNLLSTLADHLDPEVT